MSVKQILNRLRRRGTYQEVLTSDKDGNIRYTYLLYNELRHKFYTQDELWSVHRRTIGKREAEILLAKTLNLLTKTSRVK